MDKATFDAQLKADALENGIAIDGDYIIFDNESNLDYQILTSFKLRDLLTANPVSKTRLNKTLLVSLDTISEKMDGAITIRASYRSPEYDLLTFGQSDSQLYTTGDALALSVPENELNSLIQAVKDDFTGEVGIYSWGVHIGRTKDVKEWDTRLDDSFKQKIKNLLNNDKMKNILLLGAAAAAGWWFFIRKK